MTRGHTDLHAKFEVSGCFIEGVYTTYTHRQTHKLILIYIEIDQACKRGQVVSYTYIANIHICDKFAFSLLSIFDVYVI